MFSASIRWDGASDLNAYVRRLGGEMANLNAVAGRVAKAIEADNAQSRLEGIGADGRPLANLAPATIARRFRKYGVSGSGPPLVPRDNRSRLVADFHVHTERKSGVAYGGDQWEIRGYWDAAPWLKYHVTGARRGRWRLPKRNIVGITPRCRDEVERIVKAHVADIIKAGTGWRYS